MPQRDGGAPAEVQPACLTRRRGAVGDLCCSAMAKLRFRSYRLKYFHRLPHAAPSAVWD